MNYYAILNHILSTWSLTDKLSKKNKTIGKPHHEKVIASQIKGMEEQNC